MQNKDLVFAPLRKHPELLKETVDFLNNEWPISVTARLHYLAENKDDFPCSLILLQKEQKNDSKLIGHSRLNRVLGKSSAAFLTCVLIEKSRRGHGLGKILMDLTETHASQLGCTAIYLSTTDKCEFYKHLGYQYCSQVSPVKSSSTLFTLSQLALLEGQHTDPELQLEPELGMQDDECWTGKSVMKSVSTLIEDSKTSLDNIGENPDVLYTNKQNICVNNSLQSSSSSSSQPVRAAAFVSPPTLPPPPPPPPPPPTLPCLQQLSKSQSSRTVVKASLWMMKEIW